MSGQEKEGERPVSQVPPSRKSDIDDGEVTPSTPERKSKRAVEKEDGDSSDDTAATIATVYTCRFCKRTFDKPQSLGGHMNVHSKEREQESHQKAVELLKNREQQYVATTWNMQRAGAGTLQRGVNLSLNSPAVGGYSRPYIAPIQSAAALQNWQMVQLPSPLQSSTYSPQSAPQQSSAYSPQSAPQASGGSFYDVHQLDNARPHPGLLPSQTQATGVHLPAHQQLRVNPGQHNIGQQVVYSDAERALHSGANIVGQLESAYSLNQARLSIGHLEDIVNTRSTNPQVPSNNSSGSLITCHSPQSGPQSLDWQGTFPPNRRLPPRNDAHFQLGQGQRHNFQDQQRYTCDQEPGTSVMGSVGSNMHNQAPGSGSRHMPRVQDGTGDQENYRGGNDQSASVAEAGLEGPPDISSDGESQH